MIAALGEFMLRYRRGADRAQLIDALDRGIAAASDVAPGTWDDRLIGEFMLPALQATRAALDQDRRTQAPMPVPTFGGEYGAVAELAHRPAGRIGREIAAETAADRPEERRSGAADLTAWAWRAAGGELAAVADRLSRPGRMPRLVLVPFGALGLVPWHAAGPAGVGTAGLLERGVVSYAPSARLLGRALARPRRRGGTVLVVGDPTGDLPEAGAEARALVRAFYPGAILLGHADVTAPASAAPSGPGTAEEVLAVLRAEVVALLHLACHARADPAAPWRSSVVLADRPGDVAELLGLRRTAPIDIDTVWLAGCSTNVAGADHDEAFSLASALLASGARTAFGSMWTVPDEHTSQLMFMMHHFLVQGSDPAEALNRAQRWSADPGRTPPPSMPDALAHRAVGTDDPTAWVGFQHVGA